MTNYSWRPATGLDVPNIVSMAESHFQTEIDSIFTPDPIAYSRNLTHAVVNQFYLPNTEIVSICTDENNKLLAYTWASSTEKAPWSDDSMVVVRMAHVDLTLSSRTRIGLVIDMFRIWENFAYNAQVPIICSTTMRKDQQSFLKLHEKHGYDVRGSYAYKKLSA
jgi:hypothetical protein